LSNADANPVSVSVTLVTATTVRGTNTMAIPVDNTIIAGNRSVQYLVSGIDLGVPEQPSVMSAEPAMSSGLGPTLAGSG